MIIADVRETTGVTILQEEEESSRVGFTKKDVNKAAEILEAHQSLKQQFCYPQTKIISRLPLTILLLRVLCMHWAASPVVVHQPVHTPQTFLLNHIFEQSPF